MNIIIIGNGPAGNNTASVIRKLDRNSSITIITDDKYPYYAKPRLPEFIEGKIDLNKLILSKDEWYHNNSINLLLNTSVISIDRNKKIVYTDNNAINYNKLILATGAKANIPRIKTNNTKKIFTLRTINDAILIKDAIKDIKEIINIGGGLLSLELANSFINSSKKVKIIEVNNYLLSKNINEEKSRKLQTILEKQGFNFYFNEICDEISEENNKVIIKTKNGKEITGDLIVVSAGTNPRVNLANDAGLHVEKGIIVNNYLQTNDPDIYAAGDCIQFGDKLWGFVKSSIEQGSIVAENIVNNNIKKYTGTEIDVSLKINNIDLKTL